MTKLVIQLGPYPPPHGGVQHNLAAIHAHLGKRGIPSAVINLTRQRRKSADGVYYPKHWFQVLGLLVRLRPDIVHLHIGGNLTRRLLGLSLVCGMMPRSRSVLTFHSGGYPASPEGRTAGAGTLRGFVFRRFDRIIGVNEAIVGLFRKFGVASNRIRLIRPHAIVDDGAEALMPDELQEFLQSHAPVLITVGLLEPEYDCTLQIDILGEVRERHPRAGLIIIGSGSLEEDLLAHIRSKSYGDHIALCGDMPHSVVLRAVAASDLFLRTTLYDGDSVAVREALYLGTPVIASDNAMRPEGVRLIPPADPEALMRAIEEHLHSAAPPRRLGTAGTDNIDAVLALYEELVGELRS